jgi:tetratricopeptide (TPR) repeat protein
MLSATLSKAYQRLKQGEPGEALPLLERLVEQLPTYVTPHVLMAWAHEAQDEQGAALECWQRAYFLMPNSPAVQEGLQRVMEAAAPGPPSSSPPATDETAPAAEPEAPAPDEQPATENLPFDLSEEARAETTEEAPEFDNLDGLIGELESARIEPDPDLEDAPEPDLDTEIDDVVSETLARIYETQEQYAEAAVVYRQLAQQEPARAEELLDRAVQLERRAERSGE